MFLLPCDIKTWLNAEGVGHGVWVFDFQISGFRVSVFRVLASSVFVVCGSGFGVWGLRLLQCFRSADQAREGGRGGSEKARFHRGYIRSSLKTAVFFQPKSHRNTKHLKTKHPQWNNQHTNETHTKDQNNKNIAQTKENAKKRHKQKSNHTNHTKNCKEKHKSEKQQSHKTSNKNKFTQETHQRSPCARLVVLSERKNHNRKSWFNNSQNEQKENKNIISISRRVLASTRPPQLPKGAGPSRDMRLHCKEWLRNERWIFTQKK